MWILNSLKNLLLKLINKVFGKTWLFMLILGWFLVGTGIPMFFSTEWARRKLTGIGFGVLKGYFLMLLIFLGMTLISVSNKMGGTLPATITLGVIVILGWFYFKAKKKIAEKLAQLAEKIPTRYLKIYAAFQTLVGAVILLFHKRIFF